MTDPALAQPNATTFRVVELVSHVEKGRVRIPDFQRGLRWQWEDVRRLFDSILKGYPIGNLLLWAREAPAATVTLGALKIEAPALQDALWVVDGQQRLTSLANALSDAGSADPRFALAYDLVDKRLARPKEDEPFRLPLPILFDLQRLLKWFAGHPEAAEHLDEATRVATAIREYAAPASIVRHGDEALLRDIFDRMNNYGHRLSRAEVFSALHAGHRGSGRPRNFTEIAEHLDARFGFGRIDDDTVLRAFLARRGPDVTREIRTEFEGGTRGLRDFPGEATEDAHLAAEAALERAVAFLQEDAHVPHFGFLPYRYLLVVLARFFAHHPEPAPRNRELLRRWFWRAAMVGPSIARGAYTGAMRALGSAITAEDESGSVERLLRALGAARPTFSFPLRFKSTMAEVRFVLCAMWAIGPRSPGSGQPYDRTELAAALGDRATARDALELFFPRAPGSRGAMASRVLLLGDDADGAPHEGFAERSRSLDEPTWNEVLFSHVLDASLIALLRGEEPDAFFTARAICLEALTKAFLERMIETAFEDTPPLDALDLDEDDEPSQADAHAPS